MITSWISYLLSKFIGLVLFTDWLLYLTNLPWISILKPDFMILTDLWKTEIHAVVTAVDNNSYEWVNKRKKASDWLIYK